MKKPNVTEAQMRSWQPRRPAAGLKQQIFNPVTPATVAPSANWWWGALAPAMACGLFTLMAFNHEGAGLDARPVLSLIMSNQSCAAYASGAAQSAQNHLATVTFDWTNHSEIKSIIGFKPTTNFIN